MKKLCQLGDSDSILKNIDSFIAHKLRDGQITPSTGIALGIVSPNGVKATWTQGFRDHEKKLPFTHNTLFPVGSLTKAFTALSVLKLSNENGVNVFAPINKNAQILSFSDSEISQKVSLADLLSHRVGIPAHDLLWILQSNPEQDLLARISFLDLIPNSFRNEFNYSNFNYAILDLPFQNLFGKNIKTFLMRDLFPSLGLTHTTFKTDTNPEVAKGYVQGRAASEMNTHSIYPAGGLLSSLSDLEIWTSYLLKLLSQPENDPKKSHPSVSHMFQKQVHIDQPNPIFFLGLDWLQPEFGYGMGWFLAKWNSERIFFHPGYLEGFSSLIFLMPDEGCGFVVLVNENFSPLPGQLLEHFISPLVEKSMLDRPNPISDSPHLPQTSCSTFTLWPDPKTIDGQYKDPAYGLIQIRTLNSQSMLSLGSHEWPLQFLSKDTAQFTLSAFGMEIPIAISFQTQAGRVHQISIPFALDPRVQMRLFTRINY